MAKRLAWRCRNEQQQRDKATIYNSREWHELRVQKLRANPLCERCAEMGREKTGHEWVRAAQCVHHRIPIETATTLDDMRRLAFTWGNLVSLCNECHAEVHREERSHTKAAIKEREQQRQQRWHDRMVQTFTANSQAERPTEPSDPPPTSFSSAL